jgi:hypothetical protein
MRQKITHKEKTHYIKYEGSSPISTIENTMNYMKLEEVNMLQHNLNFPFYYTREYKWFKVNSDSSIIEQIYDELNTFSDKYKDCQNIIVKLNSDYREPVIDMEIFPIIEKDSDLGDKVRLLCENIFDYVDLCVFKSGTLDQLILHDPFRNLYSERDMKFLEILPFLNCGITRFVDGKVLPIEYWELYYEKGDKYSDKEDFDDIEENDNDWYED